jgi:hypothetical protein
MAISNPFAVYNAEHNLEAQMLCNYLEQNGVEAYATLDESVAGLWSFGHMPEIHKPQIWIDKSNTEAAKALLAEYEERRSQRLAQERTLGHEERGIAVICEDCGKTSNFAESKRGTVQDCSHCGAFVDVEDGENESESWEFGR